MGFMDASSGSGDRKLSLTSVSFTGLGAGAGKSDGVGYKELLVMALPKDDNLDDAKVAEVIGVRLPDMGNLGNFAWLILRANPAFIESI